MPREATGVEICGILMILFGIMGLITFVPGVLLFYINGYDTMVAFPWLLFSIFLIVVGWGLTKPSTGPMVITSFPECIKELPKIKHSMEGVEGWLAQGKDFQIAFFEIEPNAKIPPHSHAAQFGIVMDGEIHLTIGDETRVYRKGDTYYIPEGVVHHAVLDSPVLAMDFFADANRYEAE